MSIFLQLVDVLPGCVQFDWKDQNRYYGVNSKRAGAKRELTIFIKAKLGIKSMEPIIKVGQNFRGFTRPSRFTAWRK